jgi:hypothetical protein
MAQSPPPTRILNWDALVPNDIPKRVIREPPTPLSGLIEIIFGVEIISNGTGFVATKIEAPARSDRFTSCNPKGISPWRMHEREVPIAFKDPGIIGQFELPILIFRSEGVIPKFSPLRLITVPWLPPSGW